MDRPTAEFKQIASVSGSTITFSTRTSLAAL
jgi:hypothetical protein